MAFLLLTLILVVVAIQQTRLRTDIGDFFFSGEQDDPAALAGRLQSDELARRYLVSVAHPGVNGVTVRTFMATLQQSLAASEQVRRVWSDPFSHTDIEQLLRFYAPWQVQLLSLQPARAIEQLFAPAGMTAQVQSIREALLGPDPSLAKVLLRDDPMLLTLAWFQRIGDTYGKPAGDATHSAFFLETTQPGLDTTAQQAFQSFLADTFDALNRKHGNRFTLEYTGVPVFAVNIRAQVERDITRISTLSIGVVILLAWLVFRSLRALLCLGILLISSACIALLITQWTYGYVHGLTLALGTTLIGVCIDYFIHALVHAGNSSGTQRVQAVRRIWPALLTGGATTLIGYVALSLSGFPGLRQVAVFTGSGIIAALLLSRFILPDLMGLLRVQVQPRIDLSGLLALRSGGGTRWLIVAVITALLLAGGSRMRWSDDLGNLAPSLQQLAQKDSAIRARLSSIEPGRFILVRGNDMEVLLQTAEAVQRRLAGLKRQGKLDAFYPLYPWLASRQLQTQNIRAWNDALTPGVQARWQQALAKHGLSAKAFPPLHAIDANLLAPDDVLASPAATLLSTQLLQQDSGVTAVIWLGRHDAQAVQTALQTIPGARYFSQKENIAQLSRDYRHKAQRMLAWGLAGILVLLGLRYRSAITALRILTPAALSVMLVLGGWGLSGAPMGILNLIGLLLSAAVCVDYGVFFLENRGADRPRTLQAISVSAITTAAAFASLGAAENPALHALAWTVAPGVLAGFLLCPLILGQTRPE